MSGKSLLLLRRGLAGTKLLLPAWIRTSGGSPPVRTVCLHALCRPLAAGTRCRPRFYSKGGEPEQEYPPLPAYHPDSREVFIVQVKGLPWSCSVQDLLRFFSECRIRDGERGVHLTVDRLGRPSGRAFIEMEHEEDVSKALEKHRQYLGPRYVEVSEVTNSDAEAILQHAAPPPAEDGVVKLRGLPFSCSEDDVLHFFSGLDVVENGVTMVTDGRGRNSGEAFVQFSSQEEAGKALQKHREMMGHRYIEVFPSRSSEIRSTWKRRTSPPPQSAPPPPAGRPASAPHRPVSPQSSEASRHFIHMRGLPFQTSGEDISKFFSPYVVSKIMIECGPDGRPNGEADVYFSCHRDAVAAMSRDRMNIGHRYIELFLNSATDSE
ncbi:G-rich sequence factor 1 [Oryzias melastigma]|uniref:G-rich RNA sequence binding factor 1 n=1 Tax=Oryzias melastigma TaxID=30732 RepID=A0A3B3BRV8_ORYME|nr:G-rich sequence factor 1 [Oryzias melastigma]KAF6738977.1 G-rich sequence factor 1 [Oryzias melastigma]